jgi:hypothetical protein
MADEKEESRYKPLEVGEFKSSIPAHVLAKLPESERYLVEMVSKMEERDKWLIGAARGSNQANIELDIRLSRQEKIIDRVMSKWAIFAYLLAAALPVALKVLFENWVGKHP